MKPTLVYLRKLNTWAISVALAAALVWPACGPLEESEDPTIETAQSSKSRLLNPQVPAADMKQLVSGNSEFAFTLYDKLRSSDKNLFYSPHSISLALAMAYAGARKHTEKEMAQALHYKLAQAQLHPAFNALDLDLASRGKGAMAADGKSFRLKIVNATWGLRGYHFLAPYLDTLALNYGAGLRLLNFKDYPEPSRLTINRWVEQQTESRIKDLLQQGDISSATRLVLTNAIYFNAAWKDCFETKDTKSGTFTRPDGSTVGVSMMYGEKQAERYVKGTGYEAVELPYHYDEKLSVSAEMSMLIIVPQKGQMASVEKTLSGKSVQEIVDRLEHANVKLSLPKFGYQARLRLKEVLSLLGMPTAFGGAADFSGIDGTTELFISDVLHKSFIKVDEAGTEAAAATAVPMSGSMPQVVSLVIDRPFIYLIRDHKTGAILFVGRVLDPTAA